jgi:UDP-N-acetylglucosamine diphosphorylase / glucose-1-phosphate thymidylyltransferase / UDP-N-acetylgalactosamine diphosphorylase / glucosamine-1-phosphate N-acetyltransferase / galactosamine-1-phosphate N-acetyltransferase
MHVVIFEGSKWHTFAPLALSRPTFALASGASTLLEKQVRHLRPTRLTLWARPGLADYCRRELAPKLSFPVAVNEPLDAEPAVIVSGRTLYFSRFEHSDAPSVIVEEGNLIRKAVVRDAGLSYDDVMNRTPRWMRLLDLPRMDDQARMANYVWDLLNWNEESLLEDFVAMHELPSAKPAGPYHVVHEESVWIAPDVKIEAGVVLDASRGPIMLDNACSIGANSVLKGPCYVGPHAQVKPMCVIHAGTTIGRACKVGGEINNSILTAYSNKAHDGYVGDSYLGEWVNLGAGTTTSNLKNTYGPIRLRMGATTEVETGRRHLGSLIGDHAKTAIGTRLMTGTYLGYGSMIATSALAPTFVPSFSFLTDKGREDYRSEKAVEVMKAVYARRNRVFQPHESAMVAYARAAAIEAER